MKLRFAEITFFISLRQTFFFCAAKIDYNWIMEKERR
jgi:hypothetical protein